MPASKAQQKATNKYISKAYDRINLTVAKGQRDTIKAHAETRSESVNGFINRAIQEAIERDAGDTQEAGVVSLPSDTLKAAQRAAEAAGEAVPVFVARAVEAQAQRDEMGRKMKGGKANE